MEKIRILACDPGTTNFAWSIVEIRLRGKKLQYRVIKTRMLENPLNEVKGNFRENVHLFVKEIKSIIKRYEPIDFLYAERFQARGLQTIMIEKINIMLGIMFCLIDEKTEVRFITASNWKNEYNRQNTLSIKKMCRTNKKCSIKDLYNKVRVPPHIMDAVAIGIYGGYIELKVKPFIYQKSVREVYKLFDRLEKDYPLLRKIRYTRI